MVALRGVLEKLGSSEPVPLLLGLSAMYLIGTKR